MFDFHAAMMERYPESEYALFFELANRTGSVDRRADALAVSLWPSRGLTWHGFELKTDRRDWLRERGVPEKAEAIAKYCDYWWLVVAKAVPAIATVEEVPETWGLLIGDGKKLRVAKQAVKMDARMPTRPFLASLLRKVKDGYVSRREMVERVAEAQKLAVAPDRTAEADMFKKKLDDVVENMRRSVEELGFNPYQAGHEQRRLISIAYKLTQNLPADLLTALQSCATQARCVADRADDAIKAYKEVLAGVAVEKSKLCDCGHPWSAHVSRNHGLAGSDCSVCNCNRWAGDRG